MFISINRSINLIFADRVKLSVSGSANVSSDTVKSSEVSASVVVQTAKDSRIKSNSAAQAATVVNRVSGAFTLNSSEPNSNISATMSPPKTTITEEIELQKIATEKYGFGLLQNDDSPEWCNYVGTITPNGIAAKDGRLRTGDRIQKINRVDVVFTDQTKIIELIEKSPTKISLFVERGPSTTLRQNHLSGSAFVEGPSTMSSNRSIKQPASQAGHNSTAHSFEIIGLDLSSADIETDENQAARETASLSNDEIIKALTALITADQDKIQVIIFLSVTISLTYSSLSASRGFSFQD